MGVPIRAVVDPRETVPADAVQELGDDRRAFARRPCRYRHARADAEVGHGPALRCGQREALRQRARARLRRAAGRRRLEPRRASRQPGGRRPASTTRGSMPSCPASRAEAGSPPAPCAAPSMPPMLRQRARRPGRGRQKRPDSRHLEDDPQNGRSARKGGPRHLPAAGRDPRQGQGFRRPAERRDVFRREARQARGLRVGGAPEALHHARHGRRPGQDVEPQRHRHHGGGARRRRFRPSAPRASARPTPPCASARWSAARAAATRSRSAARRCTNGTSKRAPR